MEEFTKAAIDPLFLAFDGYEIGDGHKRYGRLADKPSALNAVVELYLILAGLCGRVRAALEHLMLSSANAVFLSKPAPARRPDPGAQKIITDIFDKHR
jgi:hypothetical protein